MLSNTPAIARAAGEFALYVDRMPRPIATPEGVVSAKNAASPRYDSLPPQKRSSSRDSSACLTQRKDCNRASRVCLKVILRYHNTPYCVTAASALTPHHVSTGVAMLPAD